MATCEKIKTNHQSYAKLLGCLYINPTRFCNLSCKHCWVSPPYKEELGKEDGELSIIEIINIVKEAKKLGLDSIKLTGGEPLLRKDLKELLEFCAVSDIEARIETNGTLISKKVAKMLKKYKVGQVPVSLDSASEERHDFFRGQKGAFSRTIKGIENLRDEDIPVQVIMSLYKENLKGFRYFLRLMQKLRVNSVKINTISPLGRGIGLQGTEFVPTIKETLDFSKRLPKIRRGFERFLFLDIPMAFKGLEELKYRGCGICAIKNILGILSDGSVSICGIGFMEEDLLFGNVREDPSLLKEIWLNNPVLNRIREDIPSNLEGICGICVFRRRCLGSCRAEAYHHTKSLTSPHWFCQEAYDQGLFPSTRLIPEALRT